MSKYSEAQMALIDKHRDINTDHEWWESVTDQFLEDMTDIGVEVGPSDIAFSLSYSQGDYAAFSGNVYDWSKFLTTQFPDPEQHKEARTYLTINADSCVNFMLGGRYGGAYAEVGWGWCGLTLDDVTSVKASMVYVLESELCPDDQIGSLAKAFEDAIETFYRDKCKDLYRQLRDEYDYLTSDDVVWESLESNDMIPADLEELGGCSEHQQLFSE